MSIVSKGVDLRIEELKSQNKQLLEELFTLKKACESKEEELTQLKEKVTGAYTLNFEKQKMLIPTEREHTTGQISLRGYLKVVFTEIACTPLTVSSSR